LLQTRHCWRFAAHLPRHCTAAVLVQPREELDDKAGGTRRGSRRGKLSLLLRRYTVAKALIRQLPNLHNSCCLRGAGSAAQCLPQNVCNGHGWPSSCEWKRHDLNVLVPLGSSRCHAAIVIANPTVRHCLPRDSSVAISQSPKSQLRFPRMIRCRS
jgi:hypothetical protein